MTDDTKLNALEECHARDYLISYRHAHFSFLFFYVILTVAYQQKLIQGAVKWRDCSIKFSFIQSLVPSDLNKSSYYKMATSSMDYVINEILIQISFSIQISAFKITKL